MIKFAHNKRNVAIYCFLLLMFPSFELAADEQKNMKLAVLTSNHAKPSATNKLLHLIKDKKSGSDKLPASKFDKKQTEDIQAIIKDYLLQNPEIVRDALIALERKNAEAQQEKQKELLSKYKSELVDEKVVSITGNKDGDVTIVEFYDYNCPYCRQAHKVLEQLIKDDKNIRVIYREFPILGPASLTASKASLAAKKQGKFLEFHKALLNKEGRLTDEIILATAKDIGLDMKKLEADMASEDIEKTLQNSVGLGAELGLNGTPTFIIGDKIIPEMLQLEKLKKLVADLREKKKADASKK